MTLPEPLTGMAELLPILPIDDNTGGDGDSCDDSIDPRLARGESVGGRLEPELLLGQ